MKKILYISSFLTFLLAISTQLFAVKAYPYPIQVRQPDGTTITLLKHGDEFLHWTTSGGKLVEKGEDGFYYNASFDLLSGKIIKSDKRADIISAASVFSTNDKVTIPEIAVNNALKMRQAMYSSNKASLASAASAITEGNNRFLVVLVQFSDLKFTVDAPQTAFHNLLNQNGYSANNSTGSVHDYYFENSSEKFNPQFDVEGPVTLSRSYSYYGANNHDERYIEFVADACEALDATVDFSKYDCNDDGVIDNVFLYFAGYNEAEWGPEESIWPHQWNVSYFRSIFLDGKKLATYACTSEYKGASGAVMCGIGTFCHEFGHVLGLPDFYDVNYATDGSANALGSYSLMSGGNYNNQGKTPPYLNSMERSILGWMDDPEEFNTSGEKTIASIDNNVAFYTPTANNGEYFIYECRQDKGWDLYVDPGLLIYHVDMSDNVVGDYTAAQRWSGSGGINSYAGHQCFDLVESLYPEYNGMNMNEQVFPGRINNTSFTSTSSPNNLDWNWNETGFNITDIAYANGEVTLNLSIVSNIKGVVKNSNGVIISKADIKLLNKDSGEVNNTTSNAKGVFSFEKMPFNAHYEIEVSSAGYSLYSDSFINTAAILNLDIILKTPLEAIDEEFRKYSDDGLTYIGTGKTPATVYGTFSITPEEASLKGIDGCIINKVVVRPFCNNLDKLEIIVRTDDEILLRRDVSSSNLVLKSDNSIDISDARIAIPSDKNIYVGYGVVNADNEYPLTADAGPEAEGGFFISVDDCQNWSAVSSYNLRSSIYVSSPGEPFKVSEYNVINSFKKQYSTGDKLVLTIVKYGDTPSSTEWLFDDAQRSDGETIVLTQGRHTIKAILVYPDGTNETIRKVINVK